MILGLRRCLVELCSKYPASTFALLAPLGILEARCSTILTFTPVLLADGGLDNSLAPSPATDCVCKKSRTTLTYSRHAVTRGLTICTGGDWKRALLHCEADSSPLWFQTPPLPLRWLALILFDFAGYPGRRSVEKRDSARERRSAPFMACPKNHLPYASVTGLRSVVR